MKTVLLGILMTLTVIQAQASESVNPQITDSVTQAAKIGQSDVPDNMLSLQRRLVNEANESSITALNNSNSNDVEFQIVQDGNVVISQRTMMGMMVYFPIDYSAAKVTALQALVGGRVMAQQEIDERMSSLTLSPDYQLYIR